MRRQWLERIPAFPKIQVDEPETLPLDAEEYDRLLKAVTVFTDPVRRQHVRALCPTHAVEWSSHA